MQPIFILSLPRSGSTLLQRMLAVSPQISTTSEPWILLPLVYMLKDSGVISEYSHDISYRAIEDFYNTMPRGRSDYIEELRKFVISLYKKNSPSGSSLFLDKTPRYHLIIDEIMELFPDAKYIYLWRNPLSISASLINSYGGGKWKCFSHNVDLYDGLLNLINTCKKNTSSIHSLQYEVLIKQPNEELEKICNFLGIEYTPQMIDSFSEITLKGRMGDKVGIKKYEMLDEDSLFSWRNTFSNPLRKRWAIKYIEWIGEKNLESIGYNFNEIMDVLNNKQSYKMTNVIIDFIRQIFHLIENSLAPLRIHRKRKKNRILYK